MKLTNNELGLNIIINEDLINEIHEKCLNHYPNEFGGLLIGFYSEDRKSVFITNSIITEEFKSTRTSFSRGSQGLREKLLLLFESRPCQYYIGEWHSHPDGIAYPSSTDLNAFIEITKHDEVFIDNPILLIIGVNKIKFEYNFYIYNKQKFSKYD